jgi:hypothetical protein
MQHVHLNQRLALGVMVAASLFLSGCVSMGPRGLELSRTEFNSAIQRTDGEQLLLNIVRQRYNDPVMFLEVASVSSSISRSASLNLSGFSRVAAVPTLTTAASAEVTATRHWFFTHPTRANDSFVRS